MGWLDGQSVTTDRKTGFIDFEHGTTGFTVWADWCDVEEVAA